MPLPVKSLHKVGVSAATAAAETYVHKHPDGSFMDFYNEYGLHEGRAYHQFSPLVDPDIPPNEAGGLPPDEVEISALNLLLDAAVYDVRHIYEKGHEFLTAEGAASGDVVGIMQNSKRLGRHIGLIPSNNLRDGIELAPEFDVPLFRALTDGNTITEAVFSQEFYTGWIAPSRDRWRGCPMLGMSALDPMTNTKILLYDLYWEVSVAEAHDYLQQMGAIACE